MRSALLLLTAALAALALGVIVVACGDDDGDGGGPGPPDMTRIAQGRIFQNGRITLPHENSQSVGDALAKLQPTWVTGVIRLQKSDTPTEEEISGYKAIRDAVLESSPGTHFDVELNALDYTEPEQVEEKMADLRETFDPDGWFFDFFTPAQEKYPEVVAAAIADAHEHGEWVGGNAFGWVRDPSRLSIPPDADFLAVSDSAFKLKLSSVRTLAEKLPIVFHLANNPGDLTKEGCVYIKDYTTKQREKYVTLRASEQKKGEYDFAYPVFFPTCRPGITAYDAARDGSMFRTLEKLMKKYN